MWSIGNEPSQQKYCKVLENFSRPFALHDPNLEISFQGAWRRSRHALLFLEHLKILEDACVAVPAGPNVHFKTRKALVLGVCPKIQRLKLGFLDASILVLRRRAPGVTSGGPKNWIYPM